MSLRKGDNKKSGQKYQNRTAFKITFDTKAIEIHQRVPLDHLCQRCIDQIKWKMQYNKYKKSNTEARCVKCQQKNIFKSYRHACDKCANAHKICAKCLTPNEQLSTNPQEEQRKEERIQKEMEDYLSKLRERTRRTLLRKIQKNLVQWDDEKKNFFEIESGQQLDNLKFKNTDDVEEIDEDDEFDDFNDDDFENNDNKASSENQQKDKIEGEIPTQEAKKNQANIDSDDDDDDSDSDCDF
ncbi:hypothetical protein TTHERM_00646841 (macronuclear) [Tetrahymena thermophila SB210]|uniref:Uncharacterized protein n=1 Tax=Tetrahymena thermophila (strain SB210) TaxID=312017 RepID=A4VCQ0_TETTS|nr:hypothetical protein TTHERM_00646841 [Tetrahymena thermophila SB210]EDK31303.1 hypothetical protein TTHERM_00646841 [Tetrahymena thermophila SB210]|eukprot:XP_001471060.1 hypothetical protein TTHERM_00646841 [Tetrahymena thermophila SB210]